MDLDSLGVDLGVPGARAGRLGLSFGAPAFEQYITLLDVSFHKAGRKKPPLAAEDKSYTQQPGLC